MYAVVPLLNLDPNPQVFGNSLEYRTKRSRSFLFLLLLFDLHLIQ